MEKSLVPIPANEIYITHAEYQECFIKIWANEYTNKRSNMDKYLQDYTSCSKEFNKLDLYGHSTYIYVWKTDLDLRVYRCRVVLSDLQKKTHTIVLLDYGQKMVVPYCSVRKVIKDIDDSIINSLSQRPSVNTFLLSEYISKPKSNINLINTLCYKYYKYRKDFEIGGMTFVTLFDMDKTLIENGLADIVSMTTMITIANSMTLFISSYNSNDSINNISVSNKTMVTHSFLRNQCLDYITVIDIFVTRVNIDKTSILLTVQIIDNDSDAINDILNSLDRQNLKLVSVLEVYTPCLVVLRNKLVRAIILEVKIDGLFIALVDYGIRETIPRTAVFEVPPKCNSIEMRSLNVVLDKPKNIIIDENMFLRKYFQMLPLKMDLNFGLYKVKLFKKNDGGLIDIFNDISVHENFLKPNNSPELFSITEIQDEIESLENFQVTSKVSSNHSNDNQIEKRKLELIEMKSVNLNKTETVNQIEKQLTIRSIIPIFNLKKDSLMDIQEIVSLLIYYKSPFNFRVRQYNPDFEPFMDQIKSSLNSRYILTQNELLKNMYVIYQKKQFDSIYRGQIIDVDPEIEKIKLQLVDEGDEIIDEHFSEIILYNFIDSDCYLPGQIVLNCALSNMWFPVLNIDTISMLQPYFNKSLFYKVIIVKTDENNVKLVKMILKDTNIDISDTILKSGIGQRLTAAMKSDECPYEESLLINQSFLSYIYNYHFKLCIQPEPNIVDELEEEILEYINNNPNPVPLDMSNLQHTYCLATINNNQWYRAYIKNINEESIIVNMFDIGLLTDVSFDQIRPITSDLMKKPQLCLHCNLESKDLAIKITKKMLYNVTVKSIDSNGMLCITIKEHSIIPFSNPIVRSIEKISFVNVDGDLTYLQRSQDKLMVQKLSETLSKLNGKLESKSIVPGNMAVIESHGKYYRCIVKSINSKMAVVYCIDFGYEKQIEKKKLKFLGNSKIALLPALVTIVKTFPMAFNMSKSIFLADMHVDNDGTLNATPNRMDSIQIQNELMETLQKGCLVKVTCVYSSNDCWIVPHLFFDRLKSISDTLVKIQSKMVPAVTEIGSLCAAQNTETKKWHRALILDKNESTKNVLLIDSGEQIKVLNANKLTGDILKIPNCALRCQVISNVPIKDLLNKNVKCKLISSNKSLLEVELFSNEDVIASTKSSKEWTVVVSKFESFDKFYVEKVEDKCSSVNMKSNSLLDFVSNKSKDLVQQLCVGSIIETLTDKGDGIWYKAEVIATYDDMSLIVRLLNDGTICKSTKIKEISGNSKKLYYHCCLEEDLSSDILINDPNNHDYLSKVMMSHEWTLNTFSDEEPYKVTLTLHGLDCIDILYKLWPSSFVEDIENGNLSTIIDEPPDKGVLLLENPKNQIAKKTNIFNDFAIPDSEIVTIVHIETFKCFFIKSESLFSLYMERINIELDMCIVQLPMVTDMIGSIVVMNSKNLQRWCRAKVLEITPDCTASCYLLDYGVYDICDKFYKPTDFLCACPPIVRCCSLYTPKLASYEKKIWFSNVNDMFKDIASIEGIKFSMVIKKDEVCQDPFLVTLMLDDDDISEMLVPINVQVTSINSLTDFRISAISSGQKAVIKFLENINIPKVIVENPTIGKLYLADYKNTLKRVKFNGLGGVKYVVFDIDDTLDILSVDELYELPENISHISPFVMPCSLIFDGDQEMYSQDKFQFMADKKYVFLMCIISENDVTNPNFVKLYHDDKDVLDILKIS